MPWQLSYPDQTCIPRKEDIYATPILLGKRRYLNAFQCFAYPIKWVYTGDKNECKVHIKCNKLILIPISSFHSLKTYRNEKNDWNNVI